MDFYTKVIGRTQAFTKNKVRSKTSASTAGFHEPCDFYRGANTDYKKTKKRASKTLLEMKTNKLILSNSSFCAKQYLLKSRSQPLTLGLSSKWVEKYVIRHVFVLLVLIER